MKYVIFTIVSNFNFKQFLSKNIYCSCTSGSHRKWSKFEHFKMPSSCSAFGCTNRDTKANRDQNITFHK